MYDENNTVMTPDEESCDSQLHDITQTPEGEDVQALTRGEAPQDEDLLGQLSVGLPFLTDFWRDKYLREYIPKGGSKIKFITGRKGSGKSHLLKQTAVLARSEGYVTAEFSAREVWLHDFREIYLEIMKQCDLMECLRRCSLKVIENCGFSPDDVPEGMTFMDYLSDNDLGDAITRREIRLQLKQLFLENPLIDNNFAIACSLLTGGLLGHPLLEDQNRDLLLGWLFGDRTVRIASLRTLGLSPARITKLNARHMLRSLAQVIKIAGYSGLLVTIDDMEILTSKSSLEPIHYTRLRREDTYESIRQLIDDIDSLKYIMFLFGFDRELMDNEGAGIKSYQALWMRIQNEIISKRFNCFADIVDMDQFARQVYTTDVIQEMSHRLAGAAQTLGLAAHPIDEETAAAIIRQSRTGSLAVPALMNRATLEVINDV